MFSNFCSFQISKLLGRRGFSQFLEANGFSTKWYNSKGEFTETPSAYPCACYDVIFRWLEANGIMPAVYRPEGADFLVGKIFVGLDVFDSKGERLFIPRGRIRTGQDYETLFVEMFRLGILAVKPSSKR